MKPEEAIAFLLDGQHLGARDLVQGEVRVEDHSARHRSLAVHCTTRNGFFIKHAPAGDVNGTLAAEAAFYQLVSRDSPLAALRPSVPEFHRYDAGRQLLLLGLVAPATTMRHCTLNEPGGLAGARLAGIGEQLGQVLATCHTAGADDDSVTRSAFSRMMPWAFRVALPTPEICRDLGPLQLELIRLVQRNGDIADRMRIMRREWQWSAFTHGDVRPANVLVQGPGSLRLVDWEAAGLADPAWDLACAFEGLLALAVETLEVLPDDDPAALSARFAPALPAAQRLARGLWQSYAIGATLTPDARDALLDRSTAYIGVRLLQSAYEWSGGRTAFTPFILLTVQLAVNLLRQPAAARAAVLGIDRT